MSELNSTKDLKRTLGFWDLMGAAVGQIIGAGIMSLTGISIAMTGRSVPFAFILSAVLVLILWHPLAILCSAGHFRGGRYSVVGTLLGEKWVGIYIFVFILSNFSFAMYALSFADYAMPFLPMLSRKAIALGILMILFVLNYKGIDKFAKFQNVIIVLLTVALTLFTVYGLFEMEKNYFDEAQFLTHGLTGFATATALLTFATGGGFLIADLSGEAKNAARDIPRAIICSTVIVTILYGVMAAVAAGVFPVEAVAGKPLTLVAERILPGPLYVYFIVGGAWCAIISTLNSQFASATKPLIQAAEDGWFPIGVAKLHEKYRTPVYLLAFYLIIAVLLIVFDFNIGVIGSICSVLAGLMGMMIAFSLLVFPKKYPEQWEKCPLRLGNTAMVVLVILSTVIAALQIYFLVIDLSMNLIIGNGVVLILGILFTFWRIKTGKVKMEDSFEPIEY